MLIVVLGGGIDLKGILPVYVKSRLDKAIELYSKLQCEIVLCGKYSFLYSSLKPPFTEAFKMSEYLLEKGIEKNKLILEKRSKDTIGNAYYLKKYVFIPGKENRGVVITSDFHLQRAEYIFKKIFGSGFRFNFIATDSNLPNREYKKISERQKLLLLKTKQFLSKMKDGDHNYFKNRIYKTKFYREERPDWVKDFVAKGK